MTSSKAKGGLRVSLLFLFCDNKHIIHLSDSLQKWVLVQGEEASVFIKVVDLYGVENTLLDNSILDNYMTDLNVFIVNQ